MSHFYGTLEGFTPRGERPAISRVGGTRESGLEAIVGSNEGCVAVRLYEGEAEDGGLEDRVRVAFQSKVISNPNAGMPFGDEVRVGHDFELYDGPLSECRFASIRTNTQEVES